MGRLGGDEGGLMRRAREAKRAVRGRRRNAALGRLRLGGAAWAAPRPARPPCPSQAAPRCTCVCASAPERAGERAARTLVRVPRAPLRATQTRRWSCGFAKQPACRATAASAASPPPLPPPPCRTAAASRAPSSCSAWQATAVAALRVLAASKQRAAPQVRTPSRRRDALWGWRGAFEGLLLVASLLRRRKGAKGQGD